MLANQFVLMPLAQPGGGTGHLRRACTVANELAADAKHCTLILDHPSRWSREIDVLHSDVEIVAEDRYFSRNQAKSGKDDTLILVDARTSSVGRLKQLARHGCPVLLDDNGPAAKFAPFLIDCIPRPKSLSDLGLTARFLPFFTAAALSKYSGSPKSLLSFKSSERFSSFSSAAALPESLHNRRFCLPVRGRIETANISDTSFLDLAPQSRVPDPGGPILVCFGGEDPAGLTEPVLKCLLDDLLIPAQRITTVAAFDETLGVEVLESPNNLKNHLYKFGIVICSYGLTAFESIAAGCAVVTVDPSAYHARLSRYAGFSGLGHAQNGRLKRRQYRLLKQILDKPGILVEVNMRIRKAWNLDAPRRSIGKFLQELHTPCPVCAACGSHLPRVRVRFTNRSYYRCAQCGMTGLYRFNREDDEYKLAYFEDAYKNQYGKTYLEDFQTIKAMGQTRLKYIQKLKQQGRLLDIGCAFGPFLEAASENGYQVYGMDVSGEAVDWIKVNRDFPALQGVFPGIDFGDAFGIETFDVVSLWYVIEHFPNLVPVFEKISSIVEPGGVLAISTPHGAGISAKRSFKQFLWNSPRDHYTIWTIPSAGKLLKKWGFRIACTRITGHHPERIWKAVRKNSLLYRILMILSRLFRLGDTFEIYAVKVLQSTAKVQHNEECQVRRKNGKY